MDKHLHIIAFDVPYPVNYGDLFDVFYKLVTLHSAGIHVHLHCFENGQHRPAELHKYCAEVNYYSREPKQKNFSHKLPYGIACRSSRELLNRLAMDDHPILLEGLQCTYLLHNEDFLHRRIILRLHRIGYQFYRRLYQDAWSPLKKLYYFHESKLWKQYELSIAARTIVAAECERDMITYKKEIGAKNIVHLPPFLPFRDVTAQEGIGCFCLYHGNLAVPDNEKTVLWLLKKVFANLRLHFIIAGNDPSPHLEKAISRYPHACLVANPSEEEMQDLISKAQVHVLPALKTGLLPVKLLNALFCGRHCIVNDTALYDSAIGPACHIADGARAFQSIILQLYHKPFETYEIQLRRKILEQYFNTEKAGTQLINLIWGH